MSTSLLSPCYNMLQMSLSTDSHPRTEPTALHHYPQPQDQGEGDREREGRERERERERGREREGEREKRERDREKHNRVREESTEEGGLTLLYETIVKLSHRI